MNSVSPLPKKNDLSQPKIPNNSKPTKLIPIKQLPLKSQFPPQDVKNKIESQTGLQFKSKNVLNKITRNSFSDFKIKTYQDYIKLKDQIYIRSNTEQSLNKSKESKEKETTIKPRYPSLDRSIMTQSGFWKKQYRMPITDPIQPPVSFLGTEKPRKQESKNLKSESEQTKSLVQQVKKEMMLSGVNDLTGSIKLDPIQHSPLTQMMQNVIGDLNLNKRYFQPYKPKKNNIWKEYEVQVVNNRIEGERACARDGHSAVVSNGMMVVFGGDRNKNSLSSIHLLYLEKLFQQQYS